LAGERLLVPTACLLKVPRQREYSRDLGARKISFLEKVSHGNSGM
jgi:hypothetical protein